MIRRLLILCGIILLTGAAGAQKKSPSPAHTATGTIGGATITVKYSAPSIRGRTNLFGPGGLISRDKTYPVWRAGANAATAFDTTADIKVGNLAVPEGAYTLFVDIKNPDQWILILNKQTGQWGLTYDPKMDLGHVKMKMSTPAAPVETLQYEIRGSGNHGTLTLSWDRHSASVPIEAQK